jgi:hypothetical protein
MTQFLTSWYESVERTGAAESREASEYTISKYLNYDWKSNSTSGI